MISFSFTKKKFDKLDHHGRFKWTVKWLENIHEKIIREAITEKSMESFKREYSMLLGWMDYEIPDFPTGNQMENWIEFISDQVSFHRNQYGYVPKEFDFLPKVIEGDRKDDGPWKPYLNYSIALDGLRSAFNVGSILRVCDCAGFSSVILGKTLGDEHRGVRKISMGTSSWIPQEKTENLAELLREKKKEGFKVIGVETVENSVEYTGFNWPEKGIVVFGNEEYGISKEVLKVCDSFVYIPMRGRKNSLNVANAVSVITFHINSELAPLD